MIGVGSARTFIIFGGGFYFWGHAHPDVDSGSPYLADSEWHMYTITFDGAGIDGTGTTEIKMYIDAELKTTEASPLIDAGDDVYVGNPSNWNANLRGELDEFTIWNTTLSQEEIDALITPPPTGIPGDIDLSGVVDRADVAQFVGHYGTVEGSVFTTGDFDNPADGKTGLSDLALLQRHFGESTPASPATVPEPTTLILSVMGMMGWVFFGWRRKRNCRHLV